MILCDLCDLQNLCDIDKADILPAFQRNGNWILGKIRVFSLNNVTSQC